MRQSIGHIPQINTAIPATIAKDGIPIFPAAPVAVAGATLELDVPVRLEESEDDAALVDEEVIVEFGATPQSKLPTSNTIMDPMNVHLRL